MRRNIIQNIINDKATAMNIVRNIGFKVFTPLSLTCRNWRETKKLIIVSIPNGKALESTHEGALNIEALPALEQHVHI